MTHLTPRGRDLIQAGRQACQPTYADRARIQGGLISKLGGESLPLDIGSAATAVAAGRSLWPIVSIIVVGVGIFGGAYFLAKGMGTEKAQLTPSATALIAPSPPMGIPQTETPIANPTSEKTSPPILAVVPTVSIVRPAQDRLAAEVALLSRAMRRMR